MRLFKWIKTSREGKRRFILSNSCMYCVGKKNFCWISKLESSSVFDKWTRLLVCSTPLANLHFISPTIWRIRYVSYRPLGWLSEIDCCPKKVGNRVSTNHSWWQELEKALHRGIPSQGGFASAYLLSLIPLLLQWYLSFSDWQFQKHRKVKEMASKHANTLSLSEKLDLFSPCCLQHCTRLVLLPSN